MNEHGANRTYNHTRQDLVYNANTIFDVQRGVVICNDCAALSSARVAIV